MGENCFYALWQVGIHHPGEYVWIDSIWINQQNLPEKSSQVCLMGDIYHKAWSVLSCVGCHSDDSEALREIDSDSDGVPVRRFRTEIRSSRVRHAIIAFYNRPYWSRVWILQETALAEQLFVLFGEEKWTWTQVYELQDVFLVISANLLQGFNNIRHIDYLKGSKPASRLSSMFSSDRVTPRVQTLEIRYLPLQLWSIGNEMDFLLQAQITRSLCSNLLWSWSATSL